MKKPPNPNGEWERKNKKSRLGFFGSNPKHALPLQKRINRFDYYELLSDQVSRNFLVVLRDSVNLVCFHSRGSRSHKLDIHPERGNNLVRSVYTTDRANLVSSMRTIGKVGLCTVERVASCTTAIFVCRIDNRCRQAHLLSC